MTLRPITPLHSFKQRRVATACATHRTRILKLITESLFMLAAGDVPRILECALCTNFLPRYRGSGELLDLNDWVGRSAIYAPFNGGQPIDYLLCPGCAEWIDGDAPPEERRNLLLKIEENLSAEVAR